MKQVLKAFQISACLIGVMFILSSCNSGSSANEASADSTTPAATPVATTDASTATPKLTDPEICSVVLTADKIDIAYAGIAKEKSQNEEVLKFAATMAKDHQHVNDLAVALATKLGVTPKDNAVTQSLQSGAADTKAMLNSKTGADFNKAYIDNEVAYHKAAIDLVENTLIPDASNAELKSLLQSALPIFKEHLAHAEMVQKELAK